MDIPELIKKVKKIELTSKQIVNNLFLGGYNSSFKGRGLEFHEVRQYVYGDDTKLIDWNVTSRTTTPHIKLMKEERELNVYILIDNSSSMLFGGKKSKKETALELAAIFSYSATINNDRVGCIIFNSEENIHIPTAKGTKQAFKILREIVKCNQNINYHQQSNLDATLGSFLTQVKRKSLVIIISDFLNTNFQKNFQMLCKKHQVLPILIIDELENKMFNDKFLKYEQTKNKISFNRGKIIDDYEENYQKNIDLFKQSKVREIVIENNDSYQKKIMEYFKK